MRPVTATYYGKHISGLGLIFSADSKRFSHIQNEWRLASSMAAVGLLRYFNVFLLNRQTLMGINTTFIRPILEYASEGGMDVPKLIKNS